MLSVSLTQKVSLFQLGQYPKDAAKQAGKDAPWYSCSLPDYVGDIICNHARTEPCVPLHSVAQACDSARLYSDISDSWAQKGNGGVKEIIEFWQVRTDPFLF